MVFVSLFLQLPHLLICFISSGGRASALHAEGSVFECQTAQAPKSVQKGDPHHYHHYYQLLEKTGLVLVMKPSEYT